LVVIYVKNGDIEGALRVFRKEGQYAGIYKELKLRQHYEKPSRKKKRKQEEARRRSAKTRRRQHSEDTYYQG